MLIGGLNMKGCAILFIIFALSVVSQLELEFCLSSSSVLNLCSIGLEYIKKVKQIFIGVFKVE